MSDPFDEVKRDAMRRAKLIAVDSAKATIAAAKKASSGTLTPSQSAAMDYAYAKRHEPYLPPEFINQQSKGASAFRNQWTYRIARDPQSGGNYPVVYNSDPIAAKFLQPGTRFMWARPIDQKVLIPFVTNDFPARLKAEF